MVSEDIVGGSNPPDRDELAKSYLHLKRQGLPYIIEKTFCIECSNTRRFSKGSIPAQEEYASQFSKKALKPKRRDIVFEFRNTEQGRSQARKLVAGLNGVIDKLPVGKFAQDEANYYASVDIPEPFKNPAHRNGDSRPVKVRLDEITYVRLLAEFELAEKGALELFKSGMAKAAKTGLSA